MRQPFFVTGYQVTEENIEDIAKWCQGHIIRDAERPFIRVPVNRASHTRQTEAYYGTWVLLSVRRGEKSFKVYTQEWLDKNFFKISGENLDDVINEEIVSSTEKSPHNNENRITPNKHDFMAGPFLSPVGQSS